MARTELNVFSLSLSPFVAVVSKRAFSSISLTNSARHSHPWNPCYAITFSLSNWSPSFLPWSPLSRGRNDNRTSVSAGKSVVVRGKQWFWKMMRRCKRFSIHLSSPPWPRIGIEFESTTKILKVMCWKSTLAWWRYAPCCGSRITSTSSRNTASRPSLVLPLA